MFFHLCQHWNLLWIVDGKCSLHKVVGLLWRLKEKFFKISFSQPIGMTKVGVFYQQTSDGPGTEIFDPGQVNFLLLGLGSAIFGLG